MTANEYQEKAGRTECPQERARERIHGGASAISYESLPVPMLAAVRLLHSVVGLSGEVGEIASVVEKSVWYGRPLDVKALREEAGDVLWYFALLCNAMSWRMEELMKENIEKLVKRYPEKYTDKDCERRVDHAPEPAAKCDHAEVFTRPGGATHCCRCGAEKVEVGGHGYGHRARTLWLLPAKRCERAPDGWVCTRETGHSGPCAAEPLAGPAVP